MNLESVLFYVTHHSESIIQWVFLTILVFSGFLIARSLFGKKSAAPVATATVQSGISDNGEIHQFLQRILDQTTKLESVKLETLTPAAVADVDAQVQALKNDLLARDEELAKLKVTGEAKPSEDSAKLTLRIEELQSKLAEYEILEDDIADLSLYKEENVRLRTEIDKLKSGAPTPAPAATSAPAPATPIPGDIPDMGSMGGLAPRVPKVETPAAEATPGDDIVAEFAQAVNTEVPVATSPPPTLEETGDPMADFEAALKLEKKMTGGEAAPVAEPVAAAAPVPEMPVSNPAAEAAVQPSAPPSEGDDLFAEFAQNPAEEESLDTDKMMEEMAAMMTMEPSGDVAREEEEIDTDKMAQEAKTFQKS